MSDRLAAIRAAAAEGKRSRKRTQSGKAGRAEFEKIARHYLAQPWNLPKKKEGEK